MKNIDLIQEISNTSKEDIRKLEQVFKYVDEVKEENTELKHKIKALEYNLNEAYDTIDALAKTIRELEDERIHR